MIATAGQSYQREWEMKQQEYGFPEGCWIYHGQNYVSNAEVLEKMSWKCMLIRFKMRQLRH